MAESVKTAADATKEALANKKLLEEALKQAEKAEEALNEANITLQPQHQESLQTITAPLHPKTPIPTKPTKCKLLQTEDHPQNHPDKCLELGDFLVLILAISRND
eukprot:3926217-Amphidinium_carterae.1